MLKPSIIVYQTSLVCELFHIFCAIIIIIPTDRLFSTVIELHIP